MSALNSRSYIGRWRAAVRSEGLRAVPTAAKELEHHGLQIGPVDHALAKVRQLLDSSDVVLLATEFDGALARLAPTPQEARLDPETRSVIARMANLDWLHFAVVSGRRMDDLSARVGVTGINYVANHGLEIRGPLGQFKHGELDGLHAPHRDLLDALHRAVADLPGVVIEDKGASIACHYRIAPAQVAERLMMRVQELADAVRGKYALWFGSCVVEFRPAVNWGEKEALQWLAGRHAENLKVSTVFIAHERTDGAALELAREQGLACQVGANIAPRPGCITLDHVDEVREFLGRLASAIGL